MEDNYFETIRLDTIKNRYYDAAKVDELLDEIRDRVEALSLETQMLRSGANMSQEEESEFGEAVLSAKSAYQAILDKANLEAEYIIKNAEKQRDEIIAKAIRQQEMAISRVNEVYSKLKQQQEAGIEELNAQWQEFLCSLEDDEPGPDDLASKIDRIAREVREIEA